MKEKKKIFGILGKNISYSLSPSMHSAAFKHFGINASYEIFDRHEEEVDEFFEELISGKYAGVNVTVPYKITLCEKMKDSEDGSLDELAESLGAINTIEVTEEEGLRGYNTDGKGFCEAVAEELDLGERGTHGKRVFILGAGGASRAISFYMGISKDAPREIFVYDIDATRSDLLKRAFKGYVEEGILHAVKEEDIARRIEESDLLVNATPIGTKEGDPLPVDESLLHPKLSVYDLVYARETLLVKKAKEKGLNATGGLGMLVNQAALSFSIWTEEEFYLGDIRKVMRKHVPGHLRENYSWNT